MPEGVSGTFTQIPASVAFSALYLRVQNYVGAPSDTDAIAVAKEGINEAIDKLNTREWLFARTLSPHTMVAGTQEYALNGGFKAPYRAQLLNAAGEVVNTLEWMNPQHFDDMYPDRATPGSPEHYTVYNEFDNAKVTLALTPNAGWVAAYPTLRLRFYRRIPKLTSDADLFVGPSEAESFLVWHARTTIAGHYIPEKIGLAERRANELWKELIRDNVNREHGDI